MAQLIGNEPISAANLKAVIAPLVARIEALEAGGGGGVHLRLTAW